MEDSSKFRLLISLVSVLTVITIAYNILSPSLMPDMVDAIKRRVYFETVISKKDLGLHKAMYWREER